jgi:hypothetical protein
VNGICVPLALLLPLLLLLLVLLVSKDVLVPVGAGAAGTAGVEALCRVRT